MMINANLVTIHRRTINGGYGRVLKVIAFPGTDAGRNAAVECVGHLRIKQGNPVRTEEAGESYIGGLIAAGAELADYR